MSSMVQGDAYSLAVTVKNNGQAVEIDDIEKIEMTLLYLQKYYPGQITYADGKFYFPLAQEETFRLPRPRRTLRPQRAKSSARSRLVPFPPSTKTFPA